jgi:glycosyltransferase involved in cell wall biosynthesis
MTAANGEDPRTESNPVLTIAIPVFNRRQLVKRAIDSALAQDVDGLEIIAIDNCSTDGTWEALQEIRDPRFRSARNPFNCGLFGNLNRCLELSRGKLIKILCSDDSLASNCARSEVDFFFKNPGVVLLNTRGVLLREDGRRVEGIGNLLKPGIYHAPDGLLKVLAINVKYGRNPLNYPSGILFDRQLALSVGGFDESMVHCGDLDLWLRLLEHGDLAITEIDGTRILTHPGQAGNTSAASGDFFREQYRSVDTYKELLSAFDERAYKSMIAALNARVAYHSLRHLLRGNRQNAARNWKLRHSGNSSLFTELMSVAGLCLHRARQT